MKKVLALFAVVLTLGMSTVALDAEAKRLGGGKSSGMQRQAVTQPATPPSGGAQSVPGQAAPAAGATAAAAGGAAAASKRSWMGPIAGLAAGLGLMALASHFGFGEALANMMLIGLLVVGVLLVIGFVMRKRAGGQAPAWAGAAAGAGAGRSGPLGTGNMHEPAHRTAQQPVPGPAGGSLIGSRLLGTPMSHAPASGIPADFDAAAFARNAKAQFMALQAANDAGDLGRLQDYLSPEMFEVVRGDVIERGGQPQQTEVFGLEAQVLAVAEEDNRYVASVRFTGSVRDQQGAVPEELDEIWHLSKPRHGSGGWVVAGIQQGADGAQAPQA